MRICLYLPSIVLLVWAAVWELGVQGREVIIAAIGLVILAVFVHIAEADRRRRG